MEDQKPMGASATVPAVAIPAMARSDIYGGLARLFSYPTPELLAAMADGALIRLLRVAVGELPPGDHARAVTAATEALAEALAYDLERWPELDRWREEYLRLFDQGMQVPCPLYETEYTAAHLWQQTQAMADVAGFYRAFGVDSQAAGERPDHLAVELEFMHLLCVKEAMALAAADAGALEICRDAMTKFVGAHLGTWTGVVVELLQQYSRPVTYEAAARLADAFVQAEAVALGAAPRRATRTKPLRKDGVGPIQRKGDPEWTN